MTLFLRDKRNNSIVDMDLFTEKYDEIDEKYVEVSCSIDIMHYSANLLAMDEDTRIPFIRDIHSLSEIRSWLREQYFMSERNTEEHYDGVREEIMEMMKTVARKYDMVVVQD